MGRRRQRRGSEASRGPWRGVLTSPGMATSSSSLTGLPLAQRGRSGNRGVLPWERSKALLAGQWWAQGSASLIAALGHFVQAAGSTRRWAAVGLGRPDLRRSNQKSAYASSRHVPRHYQGNWVNQVVSSPIELIIQLVGQGYQAQKFTSCSILTAAGTGKKNAAVGPAQPESRRWSSRAGMLTAARHILESGLVQSDLPTWPAGMCRPISTLRRLAVTLNGAAPQVGSVADTIKQVVTPDYPGRFCFRFGSAQ